MDILYFLIPLSMIVMGIMIWAVIWTVRSGQYDDLEGPAHRILMDDDDPRIPHPPKANAAAPAERRNPESKD
ncbi:MAG: cbb3-type cytochrome oxidase assembly protein CcoS [Halothiobacillaceae bacterium]|nr:MAG: cbb3-type cytochrome oxidase assembly protein CcoS [Halothiobacillaceae bacterium]